MNKIAIKCDENNNLVFPKEVLEQFKVEIEQSGIENIHVKFGRDIDNTHFFRVWFENKKPRLADRDDDFNYSGYIRMDAKDENLFELNQSFIITNKRVVPLFLKLFEQNNGEGKYCEIHKKQLLTENEQAEANTLVLKMEIDFLLDAYIQETNAKKKSDIKMQFKRKTKKLKEQINFESE
jgi:hypothetical protein